ncbi:MAG: mandelate racemase/muconate lactonizing enzyme family protein [Candidatus Acidiferrales bacterium]
MDRRTVLGAGAAIAGGAALPSLSGAIQGATTPYQRPKLKITDIRTAMVVVHGPQAHVRIYTDQGLTGHGESTDAAIGTPPLINSFRRFLIGRDPLNPDAIWESLRQFGVFAGAQGGQYTTALSALDMALWDLAGKALNLPVYQLLGGKFRDKVMIYCDTDMRAPIGAEPERKIPWVTENGFKACKIDVDDFRDPNRWDRVNRTANNYEIDRIVKWIGNIRNMLPKQIELAVDMHAFYDAATGKHVAQAVEEFRLLWLEEPVPAENVDAMAEIRRSTKTRIACGENLYMRWGFTDLLHKQAVDIIQPDFQKTGGLSEARKIANLAEAYYIPVAPHCVVSPIGVMATAHVCATIPNFLCCEWHWINYPDYWKNWVKEGEIIEQGFVTPPDRPGIGVEMNEEVAKRAQMRGTTWFEPNGAFTYA